MSIILGIDPGSRITGWGVIRMVGGRAQHIDNGAIQIGDLPLEDRLCAVFDGVAETITSYQPAEFAIERVFMHRNADSALKLGQARGAAIVCAAKHDLPVHEYSATQVKQAIVGRGHADKQQIQHMVTALLNLPEKPGADAADALAIAICHGHTNHGVLGIQRASRSSRRRAR